MTAAIVVIIVLVLVVMFAPPLLVDHGLSHDDAFLRLACALTYRRTRSRPSTRADDRTARTTDFAADRRAGSPTHRPSYDFVAALIEIGAGRKRGRDQKQRNLLQHWYSPFCRFLTAWI
jgi:hypothetical protein